MDPRSANPRRGPGAAELSVECRAFKEFTKNTLRGFVTLRIAPHGITVNDICLHEKSGRRWLSFPAKPYQKDDATQWWPILEIEDKEASRQFQALALAAVDDYLKSRPQPVTVVRAPWAGGGR